MGQATDMDQEERRVTGAIKRALAQIAQQDPELARLLSETISTGQHFSYSPALQASLRRKRKRHLRREGTQSDQTENNDLCPLRFRVRAVVTLNFPLGR
jgi:hypothetical protein